MFVVLSESSLSARGDRIEDIRGNSLVDNNGRRISVTLMCWYPLSGFFSTLPSLMCASSFSQVCCVNILAWQSVETLKRMGEKGLHSVGGYQIGQMECLIRNSVAKQINVQKRLGKPSEVRTEALWTCISKLETVCFICKCQIITNHAHKVCHKNKVPRGTSISLPQPQTPTARLLLFLPVSAAPWPITCRHRRTMQVQRSATAPNPCSS